MEFIDGQAIRRFRLARGWTLQELADRIELTRQGVDRIERGLSRPSVKTLHSLIETLGVSIDSLLQAEKKTAEIAFYAFRKKQKVTSKTIESIKSQVELELLRRYWLLSNMGELPESAIPERSTEGLLDPIKLEREAEILRSKWDLGSDPIENVCEIFELMGIHVISVDADQGFDGLCGTINGGAFLTDNATFPGDRQRYNLIHELAHLFLKFGDTKEEEALVHRFAGAFLFPASRVRAELGEKRHDLNIRELELLKQKYGISQQAIIRRAFDLEIISKTTYASLNRIYRTRRWHLKEPGDPIPREKSTRIERLIARGLSEGILSEREVQERFPECKIVAENKALQEMKHPPSQLIGMDLDSLSAILEKAVDESREEYAEENLLEVIDLLEETSESEY